MPEHELLGGTAPTGPGLLAAELAITVANPSVWASIVFALLVGAVCLGIGIWSTRLVGLLDPDAPAGELLGVGLGGGMIIVASTWAAFSSGGRSAFTPVAIAFLVSVILAILPRLIELRRPISSPFALAVRHTASRQERARSIRKILSACGIGAVVVVGLALLYGATLAPSPRDGVQPVDFADVAFYSVLGRDLARTGVETNLGPSGFADVLGASPQTWYHWAEIWLAAAVIDHVGLPPIAARYFVILPLVVVAAAALTGTLVRRFGRTSGRTGYVFGFVCGLVLAPIALPTTFFSAWPAGFTFGATQYGLAAVAILLVLYCIAVIRRRPHVWTLIVFVAAIGAFVLPAHPVIAALAVVGFIGVWAVRVAIALVIHRRVPVIAPVWIGIVIVGAALVVVTGLWGLATGHGFGSSAAIGTVRPFDQAWFTTIKVIYLGAGVMLAVPVALLLDRRGHPVVAWLCLGVIIIVGFGAVAWGARLDDFNMFHVFFGGVAVFAVPVAAVAMWLVWTRLRSSRPRIAAAVAILCVAQLGWNTTSTITRLQELGPRPHNDPVPTSVLAAIRDLPDDARLAYRCRPLEEFSFVDSSLLSIDAHTGRRVVPMCFQGDVFSRLNGAEANPNVAAAGFKMAPQWNLYPSADSMPDDAAVGSFLVRYGVRYVFEDAQHPPIMPAGTTLVAQEGKAAVRSIR